MLFFCARRESRVVQYFFFFFFFLKKHQQFERGNNQNVYLCDASRPRKMLRIVIKERKLIIISLLLVKILHSPLRRHTFWTCQNQNLVYCRHSSLNYRKKCWHILSYRFKGGKQKQKHLFVCFMSRNIAPKNQFRQCQLYIATQNGRRQNKK